MGVAAGSIGLISDVCHIGLISDVCHGHGNWKRQLVGQDSLARPCSGSGRGNVTQSHTLAEQGKETSGITVPFLDGTGEKGLTFVEDWHPVFRYEISVPIFLMRRVKLS